MTGRPDDLALLDQMAKEHDALPLVDVDQWRPAFFALDRGATNISVR